MPDQTWWVKLTDLKDEQKRILALPADKDYLVLGPPGSGKTNLLLLRASYLSSQKRPFWVVLVFTATLRDFIALGVEQYKLDGAKVQTFMSFGLKLLRENNVDTDGLPDGFEERRKAVAAALKDLAAKKSGLKGFLECVLVDETQDCLPEELELFRLFGKNVFFVGDNRQRIYRGDEVLSAAGEMVDETHSLKFHYRNGLKICQAADAVGKTSGEAAISPDSNYDEAKAPSSVDFFRADSHDLMMQSLEKQLASQLKTYPEERIAVACPRSEDQARVRTFLESSTVAKDALISEDDGLRKAPDSRRVFLCTTHSLKGTEFRAVNLVHMEGMSKLGDTQKRISYTAITRAKTALRIFWEGKLPPHLQAAKAAFEPGAAKVDLNKLFVEGDE